MTDEQPPKPPSLPDDTPPVTDEDTQPTRAPLIPPPPGGGSHQPARTRRRVPRRRSRWLGAASIAALLSLMIMLVFVVLFVAFAPSEYVDPWIPGRLATRTQQAQLAAETQAALATRDAALAAQGTQAANAVAATGTAALEAANQRGTQGALAFAETAAALEGTATGAALSFDATRTAVALSAQSTIAANTLQAMSFQVTQTAAANSARAATLDAARVPSTTPIERAAAPLPTLAGSGFNTFFLDDFEDGLSTAWNVAGPWRTSGGRAFSNACGAVLTVGGDEWENFAVEVDVDSPGAQYAITLGYANDGVLYVNFGLNGALWWLADDANLIEPQVLSDAYNANRTNRIRVESRRGEVAVYINSFLAARRQLPAPTHGPVGLYTCPSNAVIPTFDNVRIARLPR